MINCNFNISEIVNILNEKYHINVKNIEKNNESTDGNVYMITTNNKKYVAKIYNNIEHTNSMVSLHSKLKLNGINVPEIIQTTEKEKYSKITNDNYIVLYSFINGESIKAELKNGKMNDKTIKSVAIEIRKLHKITYYENEFKLNLIPFENKSIRKSILHFDLTKDNILKDCNNQIAIIDFDDSKFGDSVCDIAILIVNLFISKKHGFYLEEMEKFLDEYYFNEIELKNREVPLIKEYALNWINYILMENEFDASTTESLKIKKKIIDDIIF